MVILCQKIQITNAVQWLYYYQMVIWHIANFLKIYNFEWKKNFLHPWKLFTFCLFLFICFQFVFKR